MQREILESLENILSVVSEDLRFAETKNAALLTANAAAVIGILQMDPSAASLWLMLYLYTLVIVCTLSGVVSLISFVPRPVNPYGRAAAEPAAGDNLLFYGHIQRYDPAGYLRAVYASAGRSGDEPAALERMYAEQVVVSSRIAIRKFNYFRWAIWITMGALITPPLAYVLYWGINEGNRQRAMARLRRSQKTAAPAPAAPAP